MLTCNLHVVGSALGPGGKASRETGFGEKIVEFLFILICLYSMIKNPRKQPICNDMNVLFYFLIVLLLVSTNVHKFVNPQ